LSIYSKRFSVKNCCKDVTLFSPRQKPSFVQILCTLFQAFVKPEDRADPQRTYHMMTIDAVQAFFGDLVCILELELDSVVFAVGENKGSR